MNPFIFPMDHQISEIKITSILAREIVWGYDMGRKVDTKKTSLDFRSPIIVHVYPNFSVCSHGSFFFRVLL